MKHDYINDKGKWVVGNAADNHYINTIRGGLEKYTKEEIEDSLRKVVSKMSSLLEKSNKRIKIYKTTTFAFAAASVLFGVATLKERKKSKELTLELSKNKEQLLEEKGSDAKQISQNKKSQR